MKRRGLTEKCVEETTAAKITLEDVGKSVAFLNPKRRSVLKILIDGCQIRDGNKCDFLLTCRKPSVAHFVEIKGKSKVGHSIDQFIDTINNRAIQDNTKGLKRYCWLITPIAPLLTTIYQDWKIRLRELNARFEIKPLDSKIRIEPK